jgi:hypothetical protein
VTSGTSSGTARVYFAFAPADLALVRPVIDEVRRARPGFVVDYAMTGEPFAAEHAEYIRASLTLRLRRAAAAVCLFRADVLRDDWTLWTVEVAHALRLPVIGASLEREVSPSAAELLSSAGVDIAPFEALALSRRLDTGLARPRRLPPATDALALPLRFMWHPLR